MLILIDAIAMSHPQPGGYRTYVTNLVQNLQLVDRHNQYVVAVDRPIPWTPRPGWQVRIVERRGSIGVIWREQAAIPRLAAGEGVDLIHSPAATAPLRAAPPLIVTLYDTIEFSEPLPSPKQTKRWSMRLYSRFAQRRAARQARHILTISHYSKDQIASLFFIPRERISVAHLAPSPVFSARNPNHAREEAAGRWSITGHVLGIASAARRKNIRALVEAYALLPNSLRRQHPLVLICTHAAVKSKMLTLADRSGVRDQIRLLEGVSDADLALLYSAASVFVFPSLEEGFGLPPLEAMACGAPVIASNTSSLPEVLGDAAILVSPTDIRAISDGIAAVLTDPTTASELSKSGLAQSQKYSWEATACKTREVYEDVFRQVSN